MHFQQKKTLTFSFYFAFANWKVNSWKAFEHYQINCFVLDQIMHQIRGD